MGGANGRVKVRSERPSFRRSRILAAALALAPGSLWALCVERPPEIVWVRVGGCESAGQSLENRLGHHPDWARERLEKAVRLKPGVVVVGEVLRRRAIERADSKQPTAGDWQEERKIERFLLRTRDPGACLDFEPGEVISWTRAWPCCDVQPPMELNCALETTEVEKVPRSWKAFVGETPE